MADRYAVGSGTWTSAIWATTSNGTPNAAMPTALDNVYFDQYSGNVTVDSSYGPCKTLTMVAGYVGVLTLPDAYFLIVHGSITLLPGCFTAAGDTSQINMQATGTVTSGGNLLGRLAAVSGTTTLGDNVSFRTSKNTQMRIVPGASVNLNGKTVSGNSAVNRVLVTSTVIGTPATITVNGGTFANCDFQDIAFANGGADLDLSAIAGGSGNCGGNSMSGGGTLTFTAPTTQTFASTGGNWSDIAKWTSRVPLPQDLARFQPMPAGQTITVDMPRLPDTSFAGCGSTNLPTVNLTTTGLTYSCYGSLNLTGVATGGWSCNKSFFFHGRSNASLTSNGQTLCTTSIALEIYMPGAILTALDALTVPTVYFTLRSGTFTTNYNVTCVRYSSIAGTITNMGSGVWANMGPASGTVWGVDDGVINAETSTIHLAYTGATATTFAGGTNTYNDITIAPGSGVLTFSGAFTFRNMTMSSAGTRSIVFTKGTTYTQTGDMFLSGSGVDDAPIMTPTLLNGGFETAGAGDADVFANWVESVLGTSTVTDDTSTPYNGGHACKLQCDAAGMYARIYVGALLTVGKIYKINFYAKSDNAATVYVSIGNLSASTIAIPSIAATWMAYSVYGLCMNNSSIIFKVEEANGNVYIDDITVTPLNSVLIQSSSAGEPFTLSKASGLIASNYLALKDSIATGGATWLAGYNSTNISGNTGWHFNSPGIPSPAVITVNASTATAKALCRGVPAAASVIVNASVATAKAICRGIPTAAVINVLATCSFIIATWSDNLFKASERYVGQYFKASKRRK